MTAKNLTKMNIEDLRRGLSEHIAMMTPDERKEAVLSLYTMELTDRSRARELLGINEDVYIDRVILGSRLSCLEERFDSLPDDFLSGKVMEQLKEYGEL